MQQNTAQKSGPSCLLLVTGAILLFLLTLFTSLIGFILFFRSYPEQLDRFGITVSTPPTVVEKECPPCESHSAKETQHPFVTFLDQTLQIEGSITKPEVLRILQNKRHELRKCYGDQLKQHPNLKGEFGLQFTVIQSGAVRVAIERNTSFPNTHVKECVLNEVKSWKFPKEYDRMSVVKVDALFMPVTNTGTF